MSDGWFFFFFRNSTTLFKQSNQGSPIHKRKIFSQSEELELDEDLRFDQNKVFFTMIHALYTISVSITDENTFEFLTREIVCSFHDLSRVIFLPIRIMNKNALKILTSENICDFERWFTSYVPLKC